MLLFVLLPGGACGDGDSATDVLETDASEMGAATVEIGASWEAADAGLREAFTFDFKSAVNNRPVFEKYIPTLGVAAILDYLELTIPRCHGEAHSLGKAVYAFTQDVGKALVLCGNRCTNACMVWLGKSS